MSNHLFDSSRKCADQPPPIGPNYSFNAPMFKNNEGAHPAVGQFFLAISPDSFSPDAPGQFGSRLEFMLKALAQEPGVRLPGDRRHDFRRKAENDGVQVPAELYARLKGLATG